MTALPRPELVSLPEVSPQAGGDARQRRSLAVQAWDAVLAGKVDEGVRCIEAAAAVELAEPDPAGDIWLGGLHTGIILLTGGSAEEAVAAGQQGSDAVETWNIDSHAAANLRANIAQAFLRSGRVLQAGGLVMPLTHEELTLDRAWLYEARARIELLTGHVDVAAEEYRQLLELPLSSLASRLELAECAAACELWRGEAPVALERLLPLLDEALPTELSMLSGAALCKAVRAAADLARGADQLRLPLRTRLQDLVATALLDPFAPYDAPVDAAAYGAMWEAELGRLEGTPSTKAWVRAAKAWERLDRPHDAAYCRWRGAQLALATDEEARAVKLLRRAARDARQHLPLLTAIRETTA